MGHLNAKTVARKKQKKVLKKRAKDKQRHKIAQKTGMALSENAVQHQILSEFGNAQNFVKNVLALAKLMKTDPDLQTLRFPVEAVYSHFDLAADRAALADAYANKDDLGAYDESFVDFWHDKRRAILKEFVTKEFVDHCEKVFKKLLITKKGFKKEYRAVLAGSLLVQSHRVALAPTDAPLEDNNLWELILLATVKENPKELPEPVAAPEDKPGEDAGAQSAVEDTTQSGS